MSLPVALPGTECESGYTEDQVKHLIGASRWEEFCSWMRGQTYAICEGRRYNHDARTYETACNGISHGPIYYRDDVKRFIKGLPVID